MLCVIKRESSVQDGQRLIANAMPFYLMALSIHEFEHLQQVLEEFPEGNRGTTVHFPMVLIESTLILFHNLCHIYSSSIISLTMSPMSTFSSSLFNEGSTNSENL